MPETQCVSDMYPLHNLVSAGRRMPDSCRTVAKYIVDNPELVASMSIGELADATGSNKTAVVRVSKLSGYGGYRALRAALLENRGLLRGVELLGFDVPSAAESDDLVHLAREVIRINVEVLQDSLTLLNEGTLRRTEDAIFSAKHVLLVGFGTSAPVAQDAYQRFLRLRVPSSTCADPHTLASIVATMGRDDLLFCVSNTGASRDVIEALEAAKQRGTKTITLTSVPRSVSAQLSDIVLVSGIPRKARGAETVASRVAQFAIIDIICAIIGRKKKKELVEATEGIVDKLYKKRIDPTEPDQRRHPNTAT